MGVPLNIDKAMILNEPLRERDVHLPNFIERGGTYKQVLYVPSLKAVRDEDRLEGVAVHYSDSFLLLTKPMTGEPTILLLIPNTSGKPPTWKVIVVSYEDLDTAVCYYLDVPRP
jgi:hypothetical protein